MSGLGPGIHDLGRIRNSFMAGQTPAMTGQKDEAP
jgi:hypothetical protein